MNNAHIDLVWENYPSDKSPINEHNLNTMVNATNMLNENTTTLDTTKASKTEVAPLIKEIEFNESNGIFTITRKNGSKFTIDTKLEKIAINFGYDPDTQQISITLIDGTIQYIDLSAFITEYEFMDTDTVSFFVQTDGKVTAIVKEGSIEEKHLRPNYLAEIKVEAAKAHTSAINAAKSETNAKESENASKTSETNAKSSENKAKTSETNAKTSETNAKISETESKKVAEMASLKAEEAGDYASEAHSSATYAIDAKDEAADYSESAGNSAKTAYNYAGMSQSYAVGGTGTRVGEDVDNSKYYYEQSKDIYDNFSSAGNVTGVKGNAETSYRAGNVNITAANIGLGNVNNTPDYLKSVQSATYLSGWGDTRNIETKPSDYSEKFKPVGLKTPTASKITTGSSFATLVGIRGWSDASAGKAHELAFDGNGKLLHRAGLTSWEGWREIAHIDDLNPENIGALSLNGGTMNNDANVTFESGNYTVNIRPSELILSNGNKQIYIMQGNGINSPSIKLINVDSAYEYDENVEIKSSYINITDNSSGEKLQINADNIKTKTTFTINTNNVNNHSLIINGSTKSIYSGTAISDEKYNLGTSNRKWNDIYAQNGVIQTSDRTNKMNIKNLDIEVIKAFIMGLIPSSYKMLDGTSGRTHYGFIAQDIEDLMNTLNMDSSDFAGFIKSPKKAIKYEDENGKKLENPVEEVIEGEYDYALRYDEFIAPLIKVVQEQQETINNQQQEIEKMKEDIEFLKQYIYQL